MIKNFLIIGLIVFASCKQQINQQIAQTSDSLANDSQTKIDKVNNIDLHVGTFEYVYPYNTDDLIENHYIVIGKKDSTYSGLYYGTTDEFDDAREGYTPGFFVSSMDSLIISGDTIKFTLSVKNENIYDKPVDLKIRTNEQAKKSGYKNWIQTMDFDPKDYVGTFKGNVITIKGNDEKIFKKKK